MTPHATPSTEWRASSGGYHVDQSSMHPTRFVEPPPEPDTVREYVQGAVSLLPMSEHTGGHVVVPRSHKCVARPHATRRGHGTGKVEVELTFRCGMI